MLDLGAMRNYVNEKLHFLSEVTDVKCISFVDRTMRVYKVPLEINYYYYLPDICEICQNQQSADKPLK